MVTATTYGPGDAARVSDAAWLLVKLWALAVMVLDHLDWLFFDATLGLHNGAGRTVFPLFALVLARNLARADAGHMLRRVAPRMAAVGLVAAVPYVYLAGWYPLNVMFTLAASVAIHALWRLGWRPLAAALFVVAGGLVDYQWFGLACVLGSAWAMQRGTWSVAAQLAGMAALLWPINGSLWALAAVPIFAICSAAEGPAPRLKWLFYAVYPAHLVVLASIARVL